MPNPHPARELGGSENVYSDKLIMEIALCHRLRLTPCSIIFYLCRVFASSLKVPSGMKAVDRKPPPGLRWGKARYHSVLASLVQECWPLSGALKTIGRTQEKDLVFSDHGKSTSPGDRYLGALWLHSLQKIDPREEFCVFNTKAKFLAVGLLSSFFWSLPSHVCRQNSELVRIYF